MTAVGKILVILNSLFSIAISGFVVVIFVTRTNWRTEFDKAKNVATAAEAAFKAENEQRLRDVQTEKNRSTDLERQVRDIQAQILAAKAEVAAREKQLDGLNAQLAKASADVQAGAAEIQRVAGERDNLKTTNSKLEKNVVELTSDVNKERGKAVAAKVEADSFAKRNERLLAQMGELTGKLRELDGRLRGAQPGGGGPAVLAGGPAVPEGLRGTVRQVLNSGIMTISVGSDAGLVNGAELTVFRLNGVDSKYLGKLQITQTRPKEAVGQFIAATRERPQAGDEVGTLPR